jgi:hypothetical protein
MAASTSAAVAARSSGTFPAVLLAISSQKPWIIVQRTGPLIFCCAGHGNRHAKFIFSCRWGSPAEPLSVERPAFRGGGFS